MSDENITFISDTQIYGNVALAADNRHEAVRIALEFIKSSCAGTNNGVLRHAINNLSVNADIIQQALKEKE